jgi:hypothetical protein
MSDPDEKLERAFQKLRALEPSATLEARLEDALLKAERHERSRLRETHNKRAAWLGHVRLSLPALASMAIASHLLFVEPNLDDAFVAQHHLDLPDEGHAALPLSLALDAHDSPFASIRLDVPHGMRVTPSERAISTGQPNCHRAGCVYEFVHPTGTDLPHLEVRVEKPGRYRVEVEHASERKTMREIIVVHAHR